MASAPCSVLIIENGRDRGDAIARMAKAAGLRVMLARPYRGEALLHPKWAQVIILTGGPASVCDLQQPDRLYLSRVLEYTRGAIERCTPIIGICLGHQLIARALNGKVVRQKTMEVGVRSIYPVSSRGLENRVGDGAFQAFVFHRDHVPEPPPDCMVTFRSEGCAIEGFRHSARPVHGLQFHPEIASPQAQSILRWWCSESATSKHGLIAAAAFDARPAQRLLLSLIQQYTAQTTA